MAGRRQLPDIMSEALCRMQAQPRAARLEEAVPAPPAPPGRAKVLSLEREPAVQAAAAPAPQAPTRAQGAAGPSPEQAGPLLEELSRLRLGGMRRALEQQIKEQVSEPRAQSFEHRLARMLDQEAAEREARRLKRRLSQARLRLPARLEEVECTVERGLDHDRLAALGGLGWLEEGKDLVITGPAGVGKTFITCALVRQACLEGHAALYRRLPDLLDELAAAREKGTYDRVFRSLARARLLALDDWALYPLEPEELREVLELVEERHGRASTLVASQAPVGGWVEALGGGIQVEALVDRLAPAALALELKGASRRGCAG